MSRFLRTDANGGLEFSEELVRTASGQFDVELVQHLTLASLSLRSIDRGVASQLVLLSVLDISKNNLTSLDGIEPLARTLVRLDASNNRIKSLQPLYGGAGAGDAAVFGKLEVLRLQGNEIRELSEVLPLAKQLPKLRALYLREENMRNPNPVCDAAPDYAKTMAAHFVPKCRCIDGHYFCHADVKPERLDDGDDNELVLPQSKPWLTDAFFSDAVTENAGSKFGQQSEAQVRKLIQETRAALEARSANGKFE